MHTPYFPDHRKSYIQIGRLYFWTATINSWKHLLATNEYKQVIVDSLQYLSDAGKINVYAFVIMPNHIHLIWQTLAMNGKETAQGSFLKYTAHRYRSLLLRDNQLHQYQVVASNKMHEIWQRDSLAIPLFTRPVALQKLNYLHRNPLAPHWKLAADPKDYHFSSARYYECNQKQFGFLRDLWEVI